MLAQRTPLFRAQARLVSAIPLFCRSKASVILTSALRISRLIRARPSAGLLARRRLGRSHGHARRQQRTEEKNAGNTFHHDRG